MSSGVQTSLNISREMASPPSGMIRSTDNIIVALDTSTKEQALDLVAQLREQVSLFKVGLQLYTAAGPEIVPAITNTGAKVFLDLKLHDIPNTVARAVESAVNLGVQMLTLHLSGGHEMIDAAVQAAGEKVKILGVTLLTSATQENLTEVGINETIERHVLRLARLGAAAGLSAFVASPREIKPLRDEFGQKIQLVIPGVRPSWSEPGDQKRFMTPRQAIEAGADYLVIGRPITAHANPREAVAKILDELQG